VRDRACSARDPVGAATEREIGVVAAVLVAGSENAAAHPLGLSHSTVKHHLANARSRTGARRTAQLVWILEPRLPVSPEATRVARGNSVVLPQRGLDAPPRGGASFAKRREPAGGRK
jgi:hypothetical protein